MSTRCQPCHGSGRLMSGGMVFKDCENCQGKGKIKTLETTEFDYLELKQSERFQEAKDQLKKEFPDLSDNEADKFMSDALLNEQPKKRGRPKKEV